MQADTLSGRIDNLCFLSNCNLPAALAALRSGDRIQVWMHGDRVWQIAEGNTMLLAYDQVIDAYRRAAWRRGLVFGALFIATIAILGWIFVRRKQLAPADGARRTTSVQMSFRLGESRDGQRADSFGMTVNERLVVAGIMDQFERAARDRDREAMMALLTQAGLSASICAQTVDFILAHPARYGF